MDKYEKMASEILEILKYMPEEKKNMIPILEGLQMDLDDRDDP